MSTGTPRRRRTQLAHCDGLDGLRGIAVAAVLLYHGGVSWAPGGFLGVEVFFVLSGFLITSLLVAEWSRSSTIALGAFWARRARRLLPALFCLVAVIGIYYAVTSASWSLPGLQGDGISTLLYYGNWHQIATGTSYFAATGPVSPLQHTWSLAIEEQFYILWPILLLAVLSSVSSRGKRSNRRSLAVLLTLSVTGAVASAVDMALQFDGGRSLDRVYYGTDTRAASLLLGASLAIAFAVLGPRRHAHASRRTARVFAPCSLLALAAVLVSLQTVSGSAHWLYPYGLIALDCAAALLIVAAVVFPLSPAARILALRPLRALGKISYGLYLWHFPLFLWLDASFTGLHGTSLLLLRLTATFAISVVSYVVIEQPIRERRQPARLFRGLAPVAAGGAVASLLLASAASSLPVGAPAAAMVPKPPPQLRGSDPSCTFRLKDASEYGVAPVPAMEEGQFELASLAGHQVQWSRSSQKTFQTCPPKKVLLIGDSIAFTLGVPMLSDEQRYGIQLADAGILGCAFTDRGELNVGGVWQDRSEFCLDGLDRWGRDAQAIGAQEVVVELGYRDEFDWLINGAVAHLGQPAFDQYLQSRINQFVQVLGARGRKILFLSVPYTRPPDLPDGSAPPAASPARHRMINSMLQAAARDHPSNVGFLDIDKIVSPANHYTGRLNRQLCRFDGIHFTVYCGELLEPQVLGTVRNQLG